MTDQAPRPRRPCCDGGKRHYPLSQRRYAYAVIENRSSMPVIDGGPAERRVDGYFVERIPKGGAEVREDAKLRMYLCTGGHWNEWDGTAVRRKFKSSREADVMANRLSAGMPVHRDRWIGVGAALFLAAEVVQAMKWWPT